MLFIPTTDYLTCRTGTTETGETLDFPTILIKPTSSWVEGGDIIISKIPAVNGSVTMESQFEMAVSDTQRNLKGNGIPNHPIGTFPIPEGSIAYDYYGPLPAEGYANAAEIPVKTYEMDVTVPRYPKVADKPTCHTSLMSAVAIQTGAAWHIDYAVDNFYQAVDPNAALPTDDCWGHPYATQYHYHGYSWKCFPNQGKENEHSPLFGYALDGFGVYGPRSEGGVLVTNEELDECHGHTHEIEWEGETVEMYHYHVNSEYPYTIGCFRGTPVEMDPAGDKQVSVVKFNGETSSAPSTSDAKAVVLSAISLLAPLAAFFA
jgi:hypothetical protein